LKSISRWICAAALKLAFPAWLASTTIDPAPVTVRTLPTIVPVPVLAASTENTTGFPDAPPVAVRFTVMPDVNVWGEAGCVKLID